MGLERSISRDQSVDLDWMEVSVHRAALLVAHDVDCLGTVSSTK